MAVNEAIVARALAAIRAITEPARTERLEPAGEPTTVCNLPEPILADAHRGAECYSIEHGQRQVESACWHCSGAKRCPCISCAEGLMAGESGECLICHDHGRAAAWVQ